MNRTFYPFNHPKLSVRKIYKIWENLERQRLISFKIWNDVLFTENSTNKETNNHKILKKENAKLRHSCNSHSMQKRTANDNFYLHYCYWRFLSSSLQLTIFACIIFLSHFCMSYCKWHLLFPLQKWVWTNCKCQLLYAPLEITIFVFTVAFDNMNY